MYRVVLNWSVEYIPEEEPEVIDAEIISETSTGDGVDPDRWAEICFYDALANTLMGE
jgi:hypothetical protein